MFTVSSIDQMHSNNPKSCHRKIECKQAAKNTQHTWAGCFPQPHGNTTWLAIVHMFCSFVSAQARLLKRVVMATRCYAATPFCKVIDEVIHVMCFAPEDHNTPVRHSVRSWNFYSRCLKMQTQRQGCQTMHKHLASVVILAVMPGPASNRATA